MLQPLSEYDPRQVGPYRLLGRVGAGGTGAVYLGSYGSGSSVAVKVLAAGVADDAGYRRRFRSEAAAARQLGLGLGDGSARRVARYLADGADEPTPWIASEYVPGVTLAEAVRPDPDALGRPLPRELLAGLALGLAQALAEIHGLRVVHRDLKPSNVVLGWDGPTVTDFGIALLDGPDAQPDWRAAGYVGGTVEAPGAPGAPRAVEVVEVAEMAEAGERIGTPYWMAPEQHVGAELSPPTDVFSWGTCVAYAIFGSWRSREDVLAALAAQESDGGQDLMSTILRNVVAATDRDPARRPTAASIVAQLVSAGGVARPAGSPLWTLPPDLRQPTAPGGGPAAPATGPVVRPAQSAGSPAPVVATAAVAIGVLATGVVLAAAGTEIGEVVGPVAAAGLVALLGLLLTSGRTSTAAATAVLAGLAGAGGGLVVARLSGTGEPLRVLLELAGAAVVVAAAAWVSGRSRSAGAARERLEPTT